MVTNRCLLNAVSTILREDVTNGDFIILWTRFTPRTMAAWKNLSTIAIFFFFFTNPVTTVLTVSCGSQFIICSCSYQHAMFFSNIGTIPFGIWYCMVYDLLITVQQFTDNRNQAYWSILNRYFSFLFLKN